MKKKLLLQMDCNPHASVFDAVVAHDAGVDVLLQQSGITPDDVRDQIYGLMFTRGGDDLKNSAAFIGGSDVATGEAMLKAATGSFFGNVRVSVMLDSNGCNTTAAAAVAKLCGNDGLKGKKCVVLAGTGPVGKRAAGLMALEGADVVLTSRRMDRVNEACTEVNERFNVTIQGAEVATEEQAAAALDGAYAVLCAGAAGIQLISKDLWANHPTLKRLGDINAVPPLGIEDTKAHFDGETMNDKIVFGALGIGNLKMKVHRECIKRLFASNDKVFDAEEVYAVAKEML
ncbi:methylenetetrahydromethanopterin dehydrogenase [Pseudodesulfovibrio sp. JC047]|uniref:NADP-dependent methylenetetrahydromethanopterin/methylenetetrahydrofolate dehydrogenase n=1 Tax=Pseudodesulfovibrio sp. JC047 TaxID=2683199 RepID=UPI0013D349AE|nr:NADP-dependent methylenetetrahydromethanopterin/methylenetetrahydrofolate dehydrogenase [Pseudodesulfovibrio sp. JC047]NDV19429.1 methylenetetrahydromethanopterin dehydrogenase [Pseudodesulfovibrio sp. JC047]